MELWQHEYIKKNLPNLITLTDCNVSLLAELQATLLAQSEVESIKSNDASLGQAWKLYHIVVRKADGYRKLCDALEKTKQTGALKLLREGYDDKGVQSALQCKDTKNVLQSIQDLLLPPLEPEKHGYITRLLSQRTQLKVNIFQENSGLIDQNIFVISDIDMYKLSKLVGKHDSIAESGTQLRNVTKRFIKLQHDNHFERICHAVKETGQAVHLVKFENDCLFWTRSSNSIARLRPFITDKAIDIGEDNLATKIKHSKTNKPRHFVISDSSGMGKSLLLGSLARRLKNQLHDTVVLFVVFAEFVKCLHFVTSPPAALTAILEFANPMSKVPQSVSELESTSVLLFLDGYDEIWDAKFEIANAFLKQARMLKNFHIFITTRPHLKTILEDIFDVFSHEIKPFTKSDQIDYLTTYWSHAYKSASHVKLRSFAEKCLSTMETGMTDEDNKITGVPLQCSMLAEVHLEDAGEYLEMNNCVDYIVKQYSIFELCKKVINTKLARLIRFINNDGTETAKLTPKEFLKFHALRRRCVQHHMHESIKILFPDWCERLCRPLLKGGTLQDAIIFSVGLIEKRSDTSAPKFLHRIYAEFIMAEYLVANMNKCGSCIEFLFRVIFRNCGFKRRPLFTNNFSEPDFPNISYFFEHHLEEYTQHHFTDYEIIFRYLNFNSPKHENFLDISYMLVQCCQNNWENCFDLGRAVFQKFDLNACFYLQAKNDFLKYLPHITIQRSKNINLVRKVVTFVNEVLKEGLEFCEILFNPHDVKLDVGEHRHPGVLYSTPLHTSAYYGLPEITLFLLDYYSDEQLKHMKYILHLCVRDSSRQSDAVITSKLSTIEILLNRNSEWLEEPFEYSKCTPFLQQNVHIKLLKLLVERGVSINTHSKWFGTVLHRSEGADILNWITKPEMNFTLINHPNKYGVSPLMHFIKNSAKLNVESLKLFKKAGANFDATDNDGNSVLFYALRKLNFNLVSTLITEFKVDLNHHNKLGQTAFHIICGVYCDLASGLRSLFLPLLELLVKNGFYSINHIDRLYPPLFYFVRNRATKLNKLNSIDESIFNFFHNNKADFAYIDKRNCNILYYVIRKFGSTEYIKKMIEYGANLNLECVWTSIMEAMRNENRFRGNRCFDLLEIVLDRFVQFDYLNKTYSDGSTLLHEAVNFSDLPIHLIQLFREKSADFNAIDNKGISVLQKAIIAGQNKILIQKLIDCGGSNTYCSPDGQGVLHYAVMYGNQSAVELLINKISSDSVDKLGNTPLHLLFFALESDDYSCNATGVIQSHEYHNYSNVLHLFGKNCSIMEALNNSGYIPLTNWIHKRLDHANIFSVTVDIIKTGIIYLNVYVASNVVIYFVENYSRVENIFCGIAEKEKEVFIELFDLLIVNGGSVLEQGKPVTLHDVIAEDSIYNLLAQCKLSPEFLDLLKLKVDMTFHFVSHVSNLKQLANAINRIKVDVVLNVLLLCKLFKSFFNLCEVLKLLLEKRRG